MSYKIIISAGGTGGHIYPALAVANAIKEIENNVDILFVGAKGKMEMEKIPQAGYEIIGLDIAGFNRTHLLRNINLPAKILKSYKSARSLIKKFNPDALMGFGGFASFPVLRMGQMMGYKTFIHESNAYAGKANTIIGKKAVNIFTAFDDMSRFFDPSRTLNYGNPVRKSLYENPPTKEEAVRFFDLDPSRKVLSIVGGSLGALSINKVISANVDQLNQMDIQVIWQTGASYYEQAIKDTKGFQNFRVMAFINEIQNLYLAADLIISRAGAMATAELEIMGRPVIFVPFPYAAEDHQKFNAQNLVEKDAARMVLDAEIEDKLIPMVDEIMKDTSLRNSLSVNIKKLAVYDADTHIAHKVLKETDG